MEEIEKCCGNCQYYLQFYTKFKFRFISVGKGYCVVSNNMRKKPIKKSGNIACELWEQSEDVTEKRLQTIKETISDIHKKLSRIDDVLSAEENDG